MRRQLITYKLLQPVQTNPTTSQEKGEEGLRLAINVLYK